MAEDNDVREMAMTTRRECLLMTAGALLFGLPGRTLGAASRPAQGDNAIEIWKSPTCGCCRLWVDHMRAHGFLPSVHDVADVTPFKRKLGVPLALESCHTAVVAGYAVEGHVPADVVRHLLKTRPNVAGLAVPGMPMGSPGMEGPRKEPYNVVLFDKAGNTSVFAKR
jgi:hypothetical protein